MACEIRPYSDRDFDGVKSLWREAFRDDPPWNSAERSIPAKLTVQPDLFLVAVEAERLMGTIMAGYDGHRGWLYAVAVRQSHRRQGIGTTLVREAETRLQALGCAKINLQVRPTNAAVISLYQRLGYAVEERVSMAKRF